MLSEEIIKKIKEKEITSRKQLYSLVGKSRKLKLYLDQEYLLIPSKWSKDRVLSELNHLCFKYNRLPLASDNPALTKRTQQYFGSWNQALTVAFGTVNQYRYQDFSDKELLNCISNHIKKYSRLPLREEFDGKSKDYPYWEVYLTRFNLKRFSDIYNLIQLDKLDYKASAKHGTGRIYISDSIVYLSRQEFLIGNYLKKHNINFEKEVPYGNCKSYFDFYCPDLDIYIEYYGLATKEYLARIEEKKSYYAGRKVIEIFKHDNTIKKLDSEVQRLQLLLVQQEGIVQTNMKVLDNSMDDGY